MQKLTYTNSRGQSIELSSSCPFILTKFDPGSPKTTILTSKAPGQDGKTYEGTLLEEGTLNIEGAIRGTSHEDLLLKWRQLCSIFNPKLTGTLIYTNDVREYKIICCPEEITPKDIFANKRNFLIQLYCADPFWLDVQEIKSEIAQWIGDLEFGSLEFSSDGIEFGHRESSLIVNIKNQGDVECGMRIEFTALASVVNPSLLNVYTQEFIKVKRTLVAGDKLVINTSSGNKTVNMIHNGVSANALNYIDLSSTFLQLDIGDNLLRYDAENGIDNLEVAIYFTPKYVGV